MSKVLRVGFDLDGVLLYNPARIIRAPISIIKHFFLPRRHKKFIVPKGLLATIIWDMLHLSSLFPARGFERLEKLVQGGAIEAYIITGRYGFLEKNTQGWFSRLNKKGIFTKTFMNIKNEQPHLFKERLINELSLDIFVEDNWDIVEHLSKNSRARIFWVYNILDRLIVHSNKFPNLNKVLDYLEKQA